MSLVLGRLLIVLRFVRNMKCILTERERVGDEVTLLEIKNSKLEWLKFEQHFIIQDSKFLKQKHSLNLYFDENDILRSQKRTLNAEIVAHRKCRTHIMSSKILRD